MKILEGNLKDIHIVFKVKAMPTNSQNIECFKIFEFSNHAASGISFCPSNQTLVFRFSADNSLFNVPLQHDNENSVYVLRKDGKLKISVFDIGNSNYKSKTLEFPSGFKPQFTIFNQTKEPLVKVYDFYSSIKV